MLTSGGEKGCGWKEKEECFRECWQCSISWLWVVCGCSFYNSLRCLCLFLGSSICVVFHNKNGILKLFNVSYLCKYAIILWIARDNKLTDFSVDLGEKEGRHAVSETETTDLALLVRWGGSGGQVLRAVRLTKLMCSKTCNGMKIKRITKLLLHF